MARDNETNTLELHIKVNGQNLSAISEKCNIGTLRIPSDPSWPKIPPRRSSNNIDNIIEPPCVVTLTGTPRKGHGMVQTVPCRPYPKSKVSQKCEATTKHVAKRLPGCFDPRFRRQISREKAVKADEFCDTKNDRKQTPELETHIPRGTEKLEDKSRETNESVDGYVAPCHIVDNLLSSVRKLTKKTANADYPVNERFILEAKQCPSSNSSQRAADERYDVENRSPQEEKQESGRSLLLMVDERKIHALPINTLLNIEAAPSSAQSLQCYSVQIPVVSCRDVSSQISSATQMEKDVKMHSSVRENDNMGETVENIRTRSANSSICSFEDSKNEKECPSENVKRCHARNSDDICASEKKNISKYCAGHDTSGGDQICGGNEGNIDSGNTSVSLNRDVTSETCTPGKERYQGNRFDESDNANDGGSCSNLNSAARLKNFKVGQSCAIDSPPIAPLDGCNEREMLSGRKTADNETRMHCVNTQKQQLAYRVKKERGNADSPSTNAISGDIVVRLENGIRGLASGEICTKEYGKGDKEKECMRMKGGEQRVNAKCKAARSMRPLSRKAKSFFRKKSRFAITDSDCTLILPGYRCVKGNEKTRRGRFVSKVKAENSLEKPSSIPLETRELLNKSYWEYYWKLRHSKSAPSAKPSANAAGERDERSNNEDHLPESQTLRQCSVLSCMINTALRDSTTAGVGRPSSDPAVNVTPDRRENVRRLSNKVSSVIARKIGRKEMKRASKRRLFGLRAIALLCIAMYVAVIFLPMMYDYLFVEEYDDENASYIELTFRYIASSFGDALDGVIDILTTILLRPVRFDRKQ